MSAAVGNDARIVLDSNLAEKEASFLAQIEELQREINRITEEINVYFETNKDTLIESYKPAIASSPKFRRLMQFTQVPAGVSPEDFKQSKLTDQAKERFLSNRKFEISTKTSDKQNKISSFEYELYLLQNTQKTRNRKAEITKTEAEIGDVFPLEINIPPEMKSILDSAKGIFSFAMYTTGPTFDNLFTPKPEEVEWSNALRNPVLYLYGTLTYVELCRTATWDGWKVCIFTDIETIERNPKTIAFFSSLGAFFIPVNVPDVYKKFIELKAVPSKPNNFKQAIRASRYYPLFHFDCPVLIRDADTLFESVIFTSINDRFNSGFVFHGFDMAAWPYKNTNEINEAHPLFEPSPRFIMDVSKWEHLYLSQCTKFGKKFYVSYDFNYELVETPNYVSKMRPNFINPANYNDSYTNPSRSTRAEYPYARFLAGCVTSFTKIPEEVWLNFKPFLKHYPDANSIFIDEYYLTFVLYPWVKKHRLVGFFMANYVQAEKSILISMKTTFASLVIPCLEEHGLPRDFLDKYFAQIEYEYRRNGWVLLYHSAINLMFLLCPSVQLLDEAFFSPLEGNIKNAPKMLLPFPGHVKFGRRTTRKARKLRRKSRKA